MVQPNRSLGGRGVDSQLSAGARAGLVAGSPRHWRVHVWRDKPTGVSTFKSGDGVQSHPCDEALDASGRATPRAWLMVAGLIAALGCAGNSQAPVDATPAPASSESSESPRLAAAAPDRSSAAQRQPASPSGADTESTIPPVAMPHDHEGPAVQLVNEMQADPQSFEVVVPPLRTDEQAAFDEAWKNIQPSVSRQVDADTVRGMSRWAKPQMKDYELPSSWLAGLNMEVVGATSNQRAVRFGPKVADGLELPSHSALVFRRLLAFADYDREAKKIVGVTVTIRGWVEE